MRGLGLFTAATVLAAVGCTDADGGAYARRIQSPNELIGGPSALGAVNDWIIGNQHIRIIVQDKGWSRGFGIFGGGIIDADVVRPGSEGSAAGGTGKDNFGELFPAFFLQAFEVDDQVEGSDTLPALEVVADGSDGGPAILRARAVGGDLLTMIGTIGDLLVPSTGLRYETDYVIHPGARHVEIVGRIRNTRTIGINMGSGALSSLIPDIGDVTLQLPLGDVTLFGSGNTVYAPGAVQRTDRPPRPTGFDMRFAVEDSYRSGAGLPALPGLVVDFLATTGDEVSYGLAMPDSEANYAWKHRDEYSKDPQTDVTEHSMVIPFLFSAFTGAFQSVPPEVLGAGETFEYRRYFIVGDGDVASIRDELYRLRGTGTGTFRGRVVNALTGAPERDAEIHIFDGRQRAYSHIKPDDEGRFKCHLAPGDYFYTVTAPGRFPYTPGGDRFSLESRFSMNAGGGVYRHIDLPAPAELSVHIRNPAGRALPAKVHVVGDYEVSVACDACLTDCNDVCAPRRYLFDFPLGEERRATDLSWRGPQGQRNGEFVEHFFETHSGHAIDVVRPGTYDIYVSRGIEYDVWKAENITLEAGVRTNLEALLTRTLDTTDFVSGDFHLHQRPSLDSFTSMKDRVTSAVAAGLEVAVSTDHNYISDFRPTINALGVNDWLTSIIGIEATTLEMGHFNAFPVVSDNESPSHYPFVRICYEPQADKVNMTSFDWVQCNPTQIFENLRLLARYGAQDTIIQVNHPRDTIQGYFNQYYVNPWTLEPEVPTGENYGGLVDFIKPQNQETMQFEPDVFSYDFDAIEVFNSKRFDQVKAFRLPQEVPPDVLERFTDWQCGSGHRNNAPGEVLLRQGGHIWYPGSLDDWMRLLNQGRRVTGVGNSDTHDLHVEIGVPRTYMYLPPEPDGLRRDEHPGTLTDLDVIEALKERRAMVSNGPFLDLSVITRLAKQSPSDPDEVINWRVGSTVEYASSNAGLNVEVLFTLRSTDWVDVERINVYGNGEIIDTIDVPDELRRGSACNPAAVECPVGWRCDDQQLICVRHIDDENSFKRVYVFDRDTWIAAEAMGSNNLFPVITPKESPPANIADALEGLTGGLGLDEAFGNNDGVRGPDPIQSVQPYAVTNPIWLDIDADGAFDAPGNDPGPGMPTQAELDNFQVCAPSPADPDGCPGNQVCDNTAMPARCECPSPMMLRRGNPAGLIDTALVGPLLMSQPSGPAHYGRRDIRKIFHGMHSH